ncbi:MAG TPA: 3-dehydroquinate synthase [Mycobacteriales bacterium]
MSTRIPVTAAGADPYDVVVGHGVIGEMPDHLGPATRVLLVHAPALTERAHSAADVLSRRGLSVRLAELPDGERAKDIAETIRLWETAGELAMTRDDAVVALGGGAVTDAAGFAAATWLRGVRVVHVPTTILGMVDAAVGGKTGINTPAGKNLVGAFHQPAAVLADLDLLGDLPPAERASGLAEVVKTGFIADPVILDLVEDDPTGAAHLQELVERSVTVKAQVVSSDAHEAGRREILNYGHTLGHAIERREDYRWRHGDAVAVGMVYAAALAHAAGRLTADVLTRHRELLTAVGLPTTYDAAAWPDLRATMSIDKKARGSTLRFVVLDGIAAPGLLEGPDEDLLRRAYEEVCR